MVRKPLRMLAAPVVLAMAVGCTSIKSTYLYRDDSDTKWVKKKAKGVPVTLEVPTHLRIEIVEKKYLRRINAGDQYTLIPADDVDAASAGKVPLKTYEIAYNLLTEKKIFMVDLKRPASSPADTPAKLSMTFNDDQTLASYSEEMTDNTIQVVGAQVNTLLGTVLGAVPKTPTAGQNAGAEISPKDGKPDIKVIRAILASGVFKLDDPMFEMLVREFLIQQSRTMAQPMIVAGSVMPLNSGASGDSLVKPTSLSSPTPVGLTPPARVAASTTPSASR